MIFMDPISDEARLARAASDDADREHVRRILSAEHGVVTRAAEALGISPRALHRRVIALGLASWLASAYPRGQRQRTRRAREQSERDRAGEKSTEP